METKLNHIIDDGFFYLYYDKTLLFRNGKSMPFIILKKYASKDMESMLSLYEYRFEKEYGRYKFEFYNKNIDIKVAVVVEEQEDGKVVFSFDNSYAKYDEICLTLWKDNDEKVFGLPTYEEVERKKFKCKCLEKWITTTKCKRIKRYLWEKESARPERKLAFYLRGKYFFENINLYYGEYTLVVKDKIYLTALKEKFEFRVRFMNNINELIKCSDINNPHIKKYPTHSYFLRVKQINVDAIKNYLKNHPEKNIKGIIYETKSVALKNIKPEMYKVQNVLDLDFILVVSKKICQFHAEKYFDDDLYYKDGKGNLKADFMKEKGILKYLVTIRKLLDMGIDGIYLEDKFTSKEITDFHKELIKVIEEYPKVALFRRQLSENSDDFGYYITENKKLIEKSQELYSYYLHSGECYLGKEETTPTEDTYFGVNIIKM